MISNLLKKKKKEKKSCGNNCRIFNPVFICFFYFLNFRHLLPYRCEYMYLCLPSTRNDLALQICCKIEYKILSQKKILE